MRKEWLIMLTVYLASTSIAINLFKVSPVLKIIQQDFHLTLAQGGWSMSIFSVASIVLAIPAVLINGRYGPKITGTIALSCTMLGSFAGSFAQSAGMFLLTRIFEGIGLGLMTVIAPSVIATWFPVEKRGLPMGIWATWLPVGLFVSYNAAIPISNTFGWQGLWWFGGSVTLIALLFYVWLVNNPKNETDSGQGHRTRKRDIYMKGLMTPEPWLLGLGFAGIGFANSGFVTFAPQYYSEYHGIKANLANFYVSIPFIMSIISNIISGWAISKSKKPKVIHLISICLIFAIFSPAFFLPSSDWVVPWAMTLGFMLGIFATANFTLASSSIPSLAPSPILISLGLAINNLVYNIGFLLGPPTFGSFISGGKWSFGALPLITSLLLTVAACVLFSWKSASEVIKR